MSRIALIVILSVFLSLPAFAVTVDPNGDMPQPEWHSAPVGTTYEGLMQQYPILDVEQTNIDPGAGVEGDYMGAVTFTRDGNRLFLSNRLTDNIDVFDASTYAKLTTINVGTQPCYMECSDDYLVVSCSFSDEVWVIDLDDYSTAGIFATEEQPWRVHINDAGSRAYIACDIGDYLEVIDLTTMTHQTTHPNFPNWLTSFAFNSESGRSSVVFTDFHVVPFTDLLMVADGDDNIFFFNGVTGVSDFTISGVGDVRAIDISGDLNGAVALTNSNPVELHQITLNTYHVVRSYTITGQQASFYGLGCNWDATKAYLGLSGNISCLVDFEDDNHVLFGDTYTAFWVGTSNDHQYAVSGQYRYSIIDFDSETIAGSYWGYSQWSGAVSPTEDLSIGLDPMTHEGLYAYDFSNPASISFDNSMLAGDQPEGDAPRRAAIAPNGQVAVVCNVISDNISIIDLDTNLPVAHLFIGDRVQDVAITSDSQTAVVCGMNTNSIFIVDLTTNQIVAEVPTGTRPGVVAIHPDDSYAYIANISSNTVSQIFLAGAGSFEAHETNVGVIGVVWAAYGVSSDLKVSPNGNEVIVASSFDDMVYVLDAYTMTVLATIPTGDFPIQLAFNANGDRAIATNYFSDNYTVMNINGASSTLLGTFPGGDGPLRCGYNPATDEFGVGNYYDKTVSMVDAATGTINTTQSFAGYGSLFGVDFSDNGDIIVLTGYDGTESGHLHHIDGASSLPASPSAFTYSSESEKAMVCMPGPDWVSLFEFAEAAITLDLQPQNAPIVIPADGGTFMYDAVISSNIDQMVNPQGWTRITLPNGQSVGPLMLTSFNLPPGTWTVNNLFQDVPAGAPAGEYVFNAFIGRYGQGLIAAMDSFTFTKTGIGVNGVEDWSGSGLSFASLEAEDVTGLPNQYALHAAYPNPFNPSTTVRVSLPEAADLTVAVYNMTGQLVVELAGGQMAAGQHSFTFDASDQASGLYFVKALVPGKLSSTRKVMLVK
jgi:YVTN family beta-propeller protein